VERDLYQPPSSRLLAEPKVPSRRLTHCSIAWVSGFIALPVLYFAVGLTGAPSAQTPLLERATAEDLVGCAIAGTVAAIAVAPFRRLPSWLAALAGFLPLVLFLLAGVAVTVYRLTA
jgi:hypothetical protein